MKSFNIPVVLKYALIRMKLINSTPIQAKSIPLSLQENDMIGLAQTGTGKTIAFLIPLISKLLQSKNEKGLILSPTRELAAQIQNVINILLIKINTIFSVLLIGGAPVFKQIRNINKMPRIIVGTPGRITDHLTRGSLNLKNVSILIIDESDRMLDMGFSPQLNKIIEFLPLKKQTLMFSATFSSEVLKLSKKYLQNPVIVRIGKTNKSAAKIKQDVHYTTNYSKYNNLLNELCARNGSIIIFVNKKITANMLSRKLLKNNHNVSLIHGDIINKKRERVIKNFRLNSFRILIATDVVSRGLDIPNVNHVINYDVPESIEYYIHRIGRTGRINSEGLILNLILPKELNQWRAMERSFHLTKK